MEAIWIPFIFLAGAVFAWFLTRDHYKEINKHLKDSNEALFSTNDSLKDQLFNIKEAKQIYDQLRLLIPPMKKAKPKRKR